MLAESPAFDGFPKSNGAIFGNSIFNLYAIESGYHDFLSFKIFILNFFRLGLDEMGKKYKLFQINIKLRLPTIEIKRIPLDSFNIPNH